MEVNGRISMNSLRKIARDISKEAVWGRITTIGR